MMGRVTFVPLIVLLLPRDAEAFSCKDASSPARGRCRRWSTSSLAPRSRLHVFDPQQIVDTASSLLADADLYSDAVLSHASSSIATVGTGSAVDVSAAALTVLADASSSPTDLASFSSPPEAGGITFSKASYYTVLGLYLLTFPGVWSTVKRSTTAKVKRKTFVTKGAASPGDGGKTLREQAGEIMAYMKANNYEVVEAGETITFRGILPRSLSQAFFLTFCTALGLLSLALVLQIQFVDLELPGIGKPNWFLLAFLSPYAGLYYWKAGDRVDTCQVKLSTNEDETENEIAVQGSEEELERMWRTLEWQEKGMVKIEGILDKIQTQT